MKRIIAILFTFTLASFGAHSKHDHESLPLPVDERSIPSFKDEKVGAAYTSYIFLKDALVASNASDAKISATELANMLWATLGKKAEQTARDIAKARTIDEQRMLFIVLSDQMTALVKDSKLSSGKVYVQYCQMANNNEGAFWLSNEKEIKNPYFGASMLKCGSVTEIIQ
ncbi:MAG: DUF3347 domain-containing protein [Bacteroidota bacterium]